MNDTKHQFASPAAVPMPRGNLDGIRTTRVLCWVRGRAVLFMPLYRKFSTIFIVATQHRAGGQGGHDKF